MSDTHTLVLGTNGLSSYGTPVWLVECARKLMGSIDLDPFSSEIHNSVVKASYYYDGEIFGDGFINQWEACAWAARPTGPCNVLVNPPGGKRKGTQLAFKKMVEEYNSGRVGQAFFIAFSIDALSTTNMLDYPCILFRKRFGYMVSRDNIKQRFFDALEDYNVANHKLSSGIVKNISKEKARYNKFKKLYEKVESNPDQLTFVDPSPVRPSVCCWLPPKLDSEEQEKLEWLGDLGFRRSKELNDAFKGCPVPYKIIA